MYKRIRRVGIWGMENVCALCGVLVLVIGAVLFESMPARADEAVDDLKKVALSDVAFSQRLIALETLKQKGSDAAVTALGDIAESGDLKIAVAACAHLGRVNTSGSKSELKTLLENLWGVA